jgi:hypothetical protein
MLSDSRSYPRKHWTSPREQNTDDQIEPMPATNRIAMVEIITKWQPEKKPQKFAYPKNGPVRRCLKGKRHRFNGTGFPQTFAEVIEFT